MSGSRLFTVFPSFPPPSTSPAPTTYTSSARLLQIPILPTPTMKLPDAHSPSIPALISALSASISTVQFSRSRWLAVQSTLDSLSLSLPLSSLPSSPLLSSLLSSLSQTLTLTLSLAAASQSPLPPAGKLRTNSDLAAAASSLLQLSHDLQILASSNDDQPKTNNLVVSLQIGSVQSKVSALEALIQETDHNLSIAVKNNNPVPAIVRLLDSSQTRERAVAAVARISAIDGCREALMAEGPTILNRLVRVLESEGGFSKEDACIALTTLTSVRENAVLVGFGGGVGSLLEICRSGTPAGAAAAVRVLSNLAGVEELRKIFVEENAVRVLIRVMKSGTVAAQENSMWCLCSLAESEEAAKIVVFKEGVLECVLESMQNDRNLHPAIKLLRNLGSVKYISDVIQSSELLARIVLSLSSSSSTTRTEAARALTEFSLKHKREIEDAVPRLIVMLESKGEEEKGAAVSALAAVLGLSSGLRRVFRKEEKGVVNVVLMLDPLIGGVDKRVVVEVLIHVSQSRRCRRQMVACGACRFLKRLVGMDVEGAKRLLECLEKGKFLGVFPRN